jgi:hypothetical protein
MGPFGRFLFDEYLIPVEHQLFDLFHGQQTIDRCSLVLRPAGGGLKQVEVEFLKSPQRERVRREDLDEKAVHRVSLWPKLAGILVLFSSESVYTQPARPG